MSVLPSATFAGPSLPIFVDGDLPVTIRSGVLRVEDSSASGSFISLSPTTLHPPLLVAPSYALTASPDNSFDLSRFATPGASTQNALVMSVTPVTNTTLIDNAIFFNGVVQVTDNVESGGTMTGLNGLRYQVEQLPSAGDPTPTVSYVRSTFLLQGFPTAGAINVQLPATFFQQGNISYLGATIFKLVSLNSSTQTVDVLDPSGANILTVTTNSPCVVEAIRFFDTIVTYRTAITDPSVTNLTLVPPPPM